MGVDGMNAGGANGGMGASSLTQARALVKKSDFGCRCSCAEPRSSTKPQVDASS